MINVWSVSPNILTFLWNQFELSQVKFILQHIAQNNRSHCLSGLSSEGHSLSLDFHFQWEKTTNSTLIRLIFIVKFEKYPSRTIFSHHHAAVGGTIMATAAKEGPTLFWPTHSSSLSSNIPWPPLGTAQQRQVISCNLTVNAGVQARQRQMVQ